MEERTVRIRAVRYNPEEDAAPYIEAYEAPIAQGMMILDALNYVQDEIDPTLAFRWSCRMGICGSCGMTVNGRPRLTCQDPVSDYADAEEVTVGPLDYFPVVRDLVVDITDFMEKLQSVKPWIIRRDGKPVSEGEYRQTPEELEAYDAHSACINCMLCYAACPVYGIEPAFTGPAAIALAHRYTIDSRDEGAAERDAALDHPEGVWSCTFVGECSVVCPKGVMPAEAIQRSKLRISMDRVMGTLLPGRRGRGR